MPLPLLFSVLLIMALGLIRSARSEEPTLDRNFLLGDARVRESSGLGFSRRQPGHVWTHNDSGDRPRLFAFDDQGKPSGDFEFTSGVKAKDWEDMVAFTDAGVPRLLVADCGDNGMKRSSVSLVLWDEPNPTKSKNKKAKKPALLSRNSCSLPRRSPVIVKRLWLMKHDAKFISSLKVFCRSVTST